MAGSVRPRVATFREAAVAVLRRSGKPLTCREITERAEREGLLDGTKSKNPVGTMSSIIHQGIRAARQKGGVPEFEKVDNRIGLAGDPSSGPARETPPPTKAKPQASLAGDPSSGPAQTPSKPGSRYVGKAGEHLVIAELLLRGFNANTMSVDEGIDVVATWGDLKYGFQVKTANLSQGRGTYSYNIHVAAFRKNNRDNVYYAFVLRNADCIDFLILPYGDVKKEIAQQNIGRLKNRPLYTVTIGKKTAKFTLGNRATT